MKNLIGLKTSSNKNGQTNANILKVTECNWIFNVDGFTKQAS